MKSIYKYPIEINISSNSLYIQVPKGAELLSISIETPSIAFIYCLVDPDQEEMIKREVLWLGTGWEIDQETEEKIDRYKFLGTYKIKSEKKDKSDLIWHFWIEPELMDYNGEALYNVLFPFLKDYE